MASTGARVPTPTSARTGSARAGSARGGPAKLFGAKTTAFEVVEGLKLDGFEVIVTGSSSGIGIETARAFAKAGARVILAVRDVKKAEPVAADIKKTTGNDKVEIEKLELDNLASVNDFVKRYLEKDRHLNILINNAGVMATPQGKTKDGFETQFGTNHMGHFALTLGLIPALKKAHQQTGRVSRVINVSSCAHAWSPVVFDDINFNTRPYDKWSSYGQAKTANVLFSIGLSKHFGKDGILSNAVMPGVIMTNLQQHMPLEEKQMFGMADKDGKDITHLNPDRFKTVPQGASTTVWAAVAPELEKVGGKYFENCDFSKKSTAEEVATTLVGYVDHIYDEAAADKLWEVSSQWVKNPPK